MYRGELEQRITGIFQNLPSEQRTRLIKGLQGKSYEAITMFSAILQQQRMDSRLSDAEFSSLVRHLAGLYIPLPLTSIEVAGTSLVFRNLSCVDAEGRAFESYAELHVDQDVCRNEDRSLKSFTPYQAAVHCEQQGKFNPSLALHCAILAASFQDKDNPEAKKLLAQYKDKGNGNGWHSTNTLINWGSQSIIHYPHDEDYTSHAGSLGINRQRERSEFSFSRNGLNYLPLKKALKREDFNAFIKNLSGLSDPSVLVDIGEYFQKEVRVWVSSSNEVRAAWLGCVSDGFDLGANYSLYIGDAARGVRATAGSAHAP